jgi:hypothetical protein
MNIHAAAKALNQKAAKQKLHHFCDPTLAFSNPVYDHFLSLWRNKAGGRVMPVKSDITPRDLKDYLSNIVLCHRIETNPSRYVWRLIGSNVATVVGHVTGKTFEESAPPDNLARWVECCDLVLDGGQPLRFLGRVHLNGKDYLDAENLFVPLTNDEGQPTYVMGLCLYMPRRAEDDGSWEALIGSIGADLL